MYFPKSQTQWCFLASFTILNLHFKLFHIIYKTIHYVFLSQRNFLPLPPLLVDGFAKLLFQLKHTTYMWTIAVSLARLSFLLLVLLFIWLTPICPSVLISMSLFLKWMFWLPLSIWHRLRSSRKRGWWLRKISLWNWLTVRPSSIFLIDVRGWRPLWLDIWVLQESRLRKQYRTNQQAAFLYGAVSLPVFRFLELLLLLFPP